MFLEKALRSAILQLEMPHAMKRKDLARPWIILLSLGAALSLGAQLPRDSAVLLLDVTELAMPVATDLDGDGDDDILGSRRGIDGHLAWLDNTDGQGTLSWPRAFGDSAWADFPTGRNNYVPADMDNDGDVDIVDWRRSTSAFPYWENDGQGQFSHPDPSNTPPVSSTVAIRVGDYDGDGWKDVFYYNFSARRLYINRRQGPGQPFVLEEKIALGQPPFHQFQDMVLSDYDQDGDLDVLLLSTQSDDPLGGSFKYIRLEVLTRNVVGFTASTGLDFEYYNTQGYYYQLVSSAADLDADGYPDLAIGMDWIGFPGEIQLVLLRNDNGSGAFTREQTLPDYSRHTLLDVDADGDEDLLVLKQEAASSPPDRSYEWLENTGTFSLLPHPIDSVFTGRHLFTGDLNQDGLADLLTSDWPVTGPVVNGQENAQLFCRYGMGSPGHFAPPVALTGAFGFIRDYAAGDWDGDGRADLLLAVEDGIRWIRALGDSDYAPPALLWQVPSALPAFQFDAFDTDSLPDGVAILREPGTTFRQPVVWMGNAPGSPLAFPDIRLRRADGFTRGDLEGDGDTDLLFVDQNGEITALRNDWSSGNGFALLPGLQPLPAGIPPRDIGQILLADLDRDGLGDLLVRSRGAVYFSLQRDAGDAFEDWALLPGVSTEVRILTGDFDANGRTDIRYRSRVGGTAYLFMQEFDPAAGNFSAPRNLGPTHYNADWWQLRLNEDDLPDLMSSEGYRLAFGQRGHLTASYLPAPFDGRLNQQVYPNPKRIDLDGDGEDELLAGLTTLVAYQRDFLQNNYVEGRYVWDTTNTCTYDSLFPALPDGRLTLQSGPQQQLTTTAPDGQYGFYLPDAPEHLLTALPMSAYWQVCPADTTLTGGGPHEVFFAASPETLCPLMELDLSHTPIRQCFPSTVSLAYRNAGTVPAAPVRITLVHDERLTPVQASLPWTSTTDTSLVFELAEVGVGEAGQVTVEMDPDCQNLIFGELLCFRAFITPDSLCNPSSSDWEGASLQAGSFCEGDSIAFYIENAGQGAMASPETYRLHIVNDDIVLLDAGDVQLGIGQADTIRAPARTDGFLLKVDQPDAHPRPEPVQLLTGGCLAPLDTALVNDFPGDDGNNFSVERCGIVIGPYDPNIKVPVPEGFGPQKLIGGDQPIQYTIHFQNVGTDAARTVTIRDRLSDHLDLATFRAGAASHPSEWTLLPDRTLSIVFPDINLPDSSQNEAESRGFFTFTIRPVAGILPYTAIENEAAIYFDFNPPIITNRTVHRIEKPVVVETAYAMLCPGDIYLGQSLERDTVLQEVFEMPGKDSVIWHQVDVLTLDDTTRVAVTLDEAGEWQGFFIRQDTTILDTLTSSLGCDSLVLYVIDLLTNVREPHWASSIRLSPNPATDRVRLNWEQLPGQRGVVRMYQLTGQLMAERHIWPGMQSIQWDVHTWPAGAYLLELRSGGQVVYRRWLVE